MCCLHITTLYQWLPSPPATCMLILCTLVVRSGLIEWQEFLVLMAVQLGGSESESESSESEEDQSPTNSPAGSPRYPAGAGAGVGVGLKEKASGAMGAAKTAGAAAAGAAATKLAGVMDDDDDDFANPLARPGLASRPAPAAPAPTPPPLSGEEAKLQAVWQSVDTDGSGTLDMNEVRQVFKMMGQNLNDKQLAKAYKQLDKVGCPHCIQWIAQ